MKDRDVPDVIAETLISAACTFDEVTEAYRERWSSRTTDLILRELELAGFMIVRKVS